ncbi:MAG: AAA family ATPase [Endozoicomonadaceae bacterium]|nr:AAA family ATPase [Endozoicomonadaceae bacterium]
MLSELNMVGNWFKNEPKTAWNFDEFKFDDEAKLAFEKLDIDIKFLDYSARVDVRDNHTYAPCHYFLYALKIQPLVTLANEYMAVFDLLKNQLSPEKLKVLINSSSPSHSITDSLDPYSRKNFFDVFSQKAKRLQAKDIINGNGNDTSLRGNDDFVRSIILKALPVPDASSNMLGQIIYSFSKSPAALEVLENKYSASIPYLFQDESGDELLFKILSTLGWKNKLDSLLLSHSGEAINWGTINGAFLLKAANVVGNNQYIETPIHYSKSLDKYVFIKKGLLSTELELKTVSSLISALWPNTTIHSDNSTFFFKSSDRIDTAHTVFHNASNTIFYGAPGTGKSHKIHTEICKNAEKIITVFHPDTQYNDFVGALKPMMKKDSSDNSVVTYEFRPGPFTNALVKAKTSPNIHIYLVIEEINRAPAAAVFGELFQLLDRNENGESTYKIDAADPDMLMYLNEQLQTAGVAELTQLEIPKNLSILATMNSSDQAVMPLDTAFKRRWSFEYLGIDFTNPAVPKTVIDLQTENGCFSIGWSDLAKIINDVLIETNIAEDRLIGPFFLNPKELSDSSSAKNAINGKLFVYLWDDVLRHLGHHKVFSTAYKTFGKLSNAFIQNMAVFSSSIEKEIEAKGVEVKVAEASQNAAE